MSNIVVNEEKTGAIYFDPLTEQQHRVDLGDNQEIMTLIEQRLSKGLREYKHGVRVSDDTRQWGCESWEDMALEEILDGMIYMAASIIKIKRRRRAESKDP